MRIFERTPLRAADRNQMASSWRFQMEFSQWAHRNRMSLSWKSGISLSESEWGLRWANLEYMYSNDCSTQWRMNWEFP